MSDALIATITAPLQSGDRVFEHEATRLDFSGRLNQYEEYVQWPDKRRLRPDSEPVGGALTGRRGNCLGIAIKMLTLGPDPPMVIS
jgi:hypothetical protein